MVPLVRRFALLGAVCIPAALLGACGTELEPTEPYVWTANERPDPPYSCQFAGNIECAVREQLALGEVSSLGFSANEVLPSIIGRYEIPIAWVTPCVDNTACGPGSDCSRFDEQPPVSVAGTSTTVTVELSAIGAASVAAPGPDQPECGQFMQIPATLSVRSADGALDMTRDIPIWTECGNELSVGFVSPATQLGGNLGAELGDAVVSQLRFVATYDELDYLRLSFIRQVENAPRPVSLMADMLLGAPTCQQHIRREDVLVGE